MRSAVLLVLAAALLAGAGLVATRAALDHLSQQEGEAAARRWAATLAVSAPGPEAAALLERAMTAAGIQGLIVRDADGAVLLSAGQAPGGTAMPVPLPGAVAWGEAEILLDPARHGALHGRALLLGAAGLTVALLPLGIVVGVLVWRHSRMRSAAEERLSYLTQHDPLTGLPNRARAQVLLDEALATAGRYGGTVAVLLVDLDRFREVNGAVGQAGGDAVLREAAERLRAAVRRHDHVGRLAADEFVVIQTGLYGAAGAIRLAERLSACLREPFTIAGQVVPGGASIGIALGPRDGVDAAALLRHADAALGRAKLETRGSWRSYEPGMDAALQARRRIERDLRAAIETGTLAVYYQSLHGLPGRERIGYEALVRWPHPEHGLVSPADFIPLAEETGLIVPLGAWVLRTACEEAARWPQALQLSVNLSPAQFRQHDIVATVRQALQASGLAPQRLELEITEGLLLNDTEAVVRQLEALRALGVRIVMDDFGTGYSSLAYLWRFPFDKLKIDRSFVRDLETDARAAAIVETIIGLCRVLRIPVTAEGVETEAQIRTLAEIGCDQVQGFLLGRPVPPGALGLASEPSPALMRAAE